MTKVNRNLTVTRAGAATTAFALGSALAWAQVPAPMTSATPTQQIRLPDSDDIGSVVFAPHGGSVYIHVRLRAIDVWSLAVHYWPEVLGVLGGFTLLVIAVLAWRTARRRRSPGEPYCRRCNYHLAGMTPGGSMPCPECGTDLAKRRPVIGRTLRRRLAPFTAFAGVIVLTYAGMFVARVPRDGRVSRWCFWPSTGAERWAADHSTAWLTPFSRFCNRVVEVDTTTGRRVRTVFTQQGFTDLPLRVSPNGSSLYFTSNDGQGIGEFSIATGRELYKVRLWEYAHPESPGVLGTNPGASTVYIGYLDESHAKDVIASWTPSTGTVKRLIERSAPSGWPGRCLLLPGDGPRFLIASNFTEAYGNGRYPGYDVAVWSASSGEEKPIRIFPASPSSAPAVTPDGRRVFVSGGVAGISGADLATGESLGVLRMPSISDSPEDQIAVGPTRYLFVPVYPHRILIRDIQAPAWKAALVIPSKFIHPTPTVSPDGRWLAVVAFSTPSGATGGPFIHELLLYDLTQVLPANP